MYDVTLFERVTEGIFSGAATTTDQGPLGIGADDNAGIGTHSGATFNRTGKAIAHRTHLRRIQPSQVS